MDFYNFDVRQPKNFELDEGTEDAIREQLVDMGLDEETIEECIELARKGESFDVDENGNIEVKTKTKKGRKKR